MKTNQLILILVIIVFASIGATMIAYSSYKIVGKQSVLYDFRIDDKVGFVLNFDALHLGRFPPGGASSQRDMIITNDNKFPVKVEIHKTGDYAEYVQPNENFFIMKEKSERKVSFRVSVPKNTSYGNYSGYVTFIYKRV